MKHSTEGVILDISGGLSMRKIFLGTIVLVASLACIAVADDQSAARAILDEAIKAHGGEAALSKIVGMYIKSKGTEYDGNNKASVSFEFFLEGNGKMRTVSFGENNKIDEIEVVNGDEGWVKDDQQSTEKLSGEQMQSRREYIYETWATMLVPLTANDFRLSVLDENSVSGRKAVGILVSHEKHNPVRLYFDKESHLLVKCGQKHKNPDVGKEVDEECVYSDYRTVQGTKQSFTVATSWDGVKNSDVVISEMKLFDKPLDEKLFEKP